MMATLNILVEAAKLVEYDKDIYDHRKKSLGLHSLPLGSDRHIGSGTCNKSSLRITQPGKVQHDSSNKILIDLRRGARENHNILEKNRRADMKNYFQKLKYNLPKLRDMVKASNVSILTVAVRYIRDLTIADREYQVEIQRLKRVQSELEARIKVLKEDINKQHFPSIFGEEAETGNNSYTLTTTTTTNSSSPKKMRTVEIQANESDIKAELPPPPDEEIDVVGVPKNSRTCLTDLRNDFSQNVHTSAERLSLIMNPKLSPVSVSLLEIENPQKPLDPLDRLNYHGGNCVSKERENRPIIKEAKHTSRRKRKLVAENDDTDSDNDLRIILDED